MLRAVFFDAAGTLFEPREAVGSSYARIARAHGLRADATAVSAAFRRAFGQAPPCAFGPGRLVPELRRLERQWWRELVWDTFAALGSFADFETYFSALFDFFADPGNWVTHPAVAPLLQLLKEQGLILGVISNFDHRLYGIVEGLGLAHYLDSITISSEVGWAKPSVEVFRAALARHRLAPDQALHVGDSEHLDLAGARAAGLAAIIIKPGLGPRVEAQERWAQVDSPAAIPAVIRQLTSQDAATGGA